MTIMVNKYAIYPGSVTLYDGTVLSFTASELAELYGVQDEPYLTVNTPLEAPNDMEYLEYIHLKPRADDQYQNYKVYAQDDDQVITWGRDFDASKKYTMETDPDTLADHDQV